MRLFNTGLFEIIMQHDIMNLISREFIKKPQIFGIRKIPNTNA